MTREAIVVEAKLQLSPGTDLRAPGGEVTRELCGHWEHTGSCRWPHNSQIDADTIPAGFRTIVVLSKEDRDEVVRRIAVALRDDERWQVAEFDVRSVAEDEQGLARRLAQP